MEPAQLKQKNHHHVTSLTSWAVVGSVLGELSQTVKVLLAVVTGEDGFVVQVIVVIIAVLVRFSVLSTGPLFGVGGSFRCSYVCRETQNKFVFVTMNDHSRIFVPL